MHRDALRKLLWACLAGAALFAAWGWFRPYEWRPPPAAGCHIVETLVKRDGAFRWIDVHVRANAAGPLELTRPVRLVPAAGEPLEPASTTSGGEPGKPPEIWFKFWLDSPALAGPLDLRIEGGSLRVKSTPVAPDLGGASYRNFTTHRW